MREGLIRGDKDWQMSLKEEGEVRRRRAILFFQVFEMSSCFEITKRHVSVIFFSLVVIFSLVSFVGMSVCMFVVDSSSLSFSCV